MINQLNNMIDQFRKDNNGNYPTHLLIHPHDCLNLITEIYKEGYITSEGIVSYLSAKLIRSLDVEIDKYYFL